MIEILVQHLNGFLPYLTSIGSFIYVIIFFVALLESTPGIGTFTPGTFILIFFGFVASQGEVNMYISILAAALGAGLGDTGVFMLGKYGRKFIKEHKGLLRLSHIEFGRAFFIKHGKKSILFGRFIGPIRQIIPLVAGMIHMSLQKFSILNIFGAFVWAGVYIGLGYFFGSKWQVINSIVSKVGFTSTILVIVAGGFLFYINRQRRLNNVVTEAEAVTGLDLSKQDIRESDLPDANA